MKTTTDNTRHLFCAGAATLPLAASGVHSQPALVDGEVSNVGREARKLMLKHGHDEHLDMPPSPGCLMA
ncbi:MAG: hypothetical protein WAQ05_18365 [Rubrivivax sp.]